MEAEELLRYLKKCTQEWVGDNAEVLITPTMYDPTKMQYDVSFIIMERVVWKLMKLIKITISKKL